MRKKVEIFFCYARKDLALLEELKLHLIPLQLQGMIKVWYDGDINLGTTWKEEIRKHLHAAHIILLLITPNFMASEYCYGNEMVWAMKRHEQGEACVIPIILLPVYWTAAPFGKLQALPKDALPLNRWPDRHEGLFDIAEGVRKTAEELISSWERAEVQRGQSHTNLPTEERQSSLEGYVNISAISMDGLGITTINANRKKSSLPGGELAARILHFIWIIDTSNSMNGDKIQSLNTAIREAIPEMRKVAQSNPHANLLVRAITFSSGAAWHIAQPTRVESFRWIDVTASGKRDMGRALKMVADELKVPPMDYRGLPPVLILITDGSPTDDAVQGIQAIMDKPWGKKAVRIAVGIGDAPYELLQQFIGNPAVRPLQANNAYQLINHIKWSSTIIEEKRISSSKQLTVASNTYSYDAATKEQQEVTVSCNGNEDCTTIRDALVLVAPNGIIYVKSGVYRESLRIEKNIRLVALSEDVSIESATPCLLIAAQDVTVQGFTIAGEIALDGETKYGAIEVAAKGCRIIACDISSQSEYGVLVRGREAQASIIDCNVHDTQWGSIVFDHQTRGWLEQCRISSNSWIGVYIGHNCAIELHHCIIQHAKSTGIFINHGATVTINTTSIDNNKSTGIHVDYGTLNATKCNITKNGEGIFVENGIDIELINCAINDNQLQANIIDSNVVIQGGSIATNRHTYALVFGGQSRGNIYSCKITSEQRGILTIGRANLQLVDCILDTAWPYVHITQESVVTCINCKTLRNGYYSKEDSGQLIYQDDTIW